MNNIVKRTTMIVRDAGRSLEFYRDVLVTSVWYDDGIVLGGVTLPVGAQGDDLAAVLERLQHWGARVPAAPHAFEVRGADGSMLRITTLGFWGPDSCFFEINQRHPS